MKSFLSNKLFYSTLLLISVSFSLSAQQYVNLTKNAGFNLDKSEWDFIADNSGGIASVIDSTGGYGGTGGLHTGYITQIAQTFDLSEIGYPNDLLDKAPIVCFSTFAKGTGIDAGDQIRYTIELRDESETIIESFSSDWIITTGDWQQITHNFINYGSGMRSVYIWMEAYDVEADQSSNQGVMIDAVNLSINNHMVYTNVAATQDLAGWENVVNGGDGWNVLGWARSSFEWCSKGQTINLMDMGYSAEALDSEPLINVWEFILGLDGPGDGTGFGDEHQLLIELKDASGNILDSYDSGIVTCTDEWQQVSNSFSDYGTGLREIYVEHKSKDIEYWSGHYGGYVDATQVTLDFCQGMTVTPTIVNETINGTDDGSIELSVSGGVADYKYLWSNGEITASINNLPDGIYDVTITDDFGCQQIESFTVLMGGTVSTGDIESLTSFEVSPNPTNGIAKITVDLSNQMNASIEVYDITGKSIQNFAQENIFNRTYELDLSQRPNGLYVIKLILDDKVVTKKIMKN